MTIDNLVDICNVTIDNLVDTCNVTVNNLVDKCNVTIDNLVETCSIWVNANVTAAWLFCKAVSVTRVCSSLIIFSLKSTGFPT